MCCRLTACPTISGVPERKKNPESPSRQDLKAHAGTITTNRRIFSAEGFESTTYQDFLIPEEKERGTGSNFGPRCRNTCRFNRSAW